MEDKLRSPFCSGTGCNVHIGNESWNLLALGSRYPIYITLFTEVNKLRSVASVYMLLDQLIASLDTVFAMIPLWVFLRGQK